MTSTELNESRIKRRRLDVRLSESELQLARKKAKAKGKSLSMYIRYLIRMDS